MDPLQTLMDEHRVIERALAALRGYGEALGQAEPPPSGDLARLARFFREYADRLHHGKEEDLLFRAMEESGMSREFGPIAVMLHEHVEGRQLVGELRDAAAADGVIPAERRPQVRNAIRTFSQLLSHHIMKEDQILYPLAEQMLPEEVRRSLASAFQHHASYETSPEEVAGLLGIVEELEARYAQPRAT